MTDTNETMIRMTVLLEQLATRVSGIDTRLSSDYVTAKELKSVTDGLLEIKQLVRDGLRQVSTDAETTERGFRELYVTKDQFEPVKRLVYGLVTLILAGVVGSLLTLVMKQGR